MLYLFIINLIAFITMKRDKDKAIKQQYRISENTLWLLAVLGGAIGATAGMFQFRHKTRHLSFRIGFPLLMMIQLVLVIYLLT
ncbi:DUF1294 domain-containing protein [Bacillus sp. V5-8f]|nr:DUF1294 domain-containing protein [Bacillus sp. V5-8f]